MSVLVDTSVWSLAFRRKTTMRSEGEQHFVDDLSELVRAGHARIIGPIRQELLSGISQRVQYERLKGELRTFRDEQLLTEDFERAAEIHIQCASRGVAGSSVDFLICAVAIDRGWTVLTTDQDFRRYASVVAVSLRPH
jgi:predicted nucleic acid-binding protein